MSFQAIPIRDSRQMHGCRPHETPDDVREHWKEHERSAAVALRGFERRPGETRLLETDESIEAYVSDNRWVATCPACNGGLACWPSMQKACCYDCGRIYDVVFPSARFLGELDDVLGKRPPANRHWRPGETVDDLKVENLVNGFPP